MLRLSGLQKHARLLIRCQCSRIPDLRDECLKLQSAQHQAERRRSNKDIECREVTYYSEVLSVESDLLSEMLSVEEGFTIGEVLKLR